MGAGSSTTRYHRSNSSDIKHHLAYCLDEESKWEDAAAIVRDVLLTRVDAPPDRVTFDSSSGNVTELALQREIRETERKATERIEKRNISSTGTGGGIGSKERKAEYEKEVPYGVEKHRQSASYQQQQGETAAFDATAYRHLLHSVDEVLRSNQESRNEYFGNIPKNEMERLLTHPTSWFFLPPNGIDRSQSSSHLFAVAALQALIEAQSENKGLHKGVHKGESVDHGKIEQTERPITVTQLRQQIPTTTTIDQPRSSQKETSQQEHEGGARQGFEKDTTIRPSTSTQTYPSLGPGPSAAGKVGVEEEKVSSGFRPSQLSSTRSSSIASSYEHLDNQRLILVAKYLFINNFLQTLTQQTEFNYKAASRLANLKKLFKNEKSFESLPQLYQLRLEKLAKENSVRLEKGLIGFDRAKAALEWLIQNYALSASVFKVDASILQLKSVESELRQHQSTVGLQTSIRQSQLSDVNLYIGWLNHRKRELIVAQQANERDALSVGFIFLDSSLSGTLEVNETPGLTAKLFNLLDGHRRNYLTLESLHECITQLSAKLDKWTMRTEKLIDDNHRLTGMATDTALYTIEKNKDELTKLNNDITEARQNLHDIYNFFHTQFVTHVFPRISPTQRIDDLSQIASLDYLLRRLEDMEESSKVTPLEQEIRLGTYESKVQLEKGASMSPTTSSMTAHPEKEKEKEKGLTMVDRMGLGLTGAPSGITDTRSHIERERQREQEKEMGPSKGEDQWKRAEHKGPADISRSGEVGHTYSKDISASSGVSHLHPGEVGPTQFRPSESSSSIDSTQSGRRERASENIYPTQIKAGTIESRPIETTKSHYPPQSQYPSQYSTGSQTSVHGQEDVSVTDTGRHKEMTAPPSTLSQVAQPIIGGVSHPVSMGVSEASRPVTIVGEATKESTLPMSGEVSVPAGTETTPSYAPSKTHHDIAQSEAEQPLANPPFTRSNLSPPAAVSGVGTQLASGGTGIDVGGRDIGGTLEPKPSSDRPLSERMKETFESAKESITGLFHSKDQPDIPTNLGPKEVSTDYGAYPSKEYDTSETDIGGGKRLGSETDTRIGRGGERWSTEQEQSHLPTIAEQRSGYGRQGGNVEETF